MPTPRALCLALDWGDNASESCEGWRQSVMV
jgi:hypothetical protein